MTVGLVVVRVVTVAVLVVTVRVVCVFVVLVGTVVGGALVVHPSSSLPSAQCATPSHTSNVKTQSPPVAHRCWLAAQALVVVTEVVVHPTSSLPSKQSLWALHWYDRGKHTRSPHTNSSPPWVHDGCNVAGGGVVGLAGAGVGGNNLPLRPLSATCGAAEHDRQQPAVAAPQAGKRGSPHPARPVVRCA